jgi:hypothetical protein
MENKKLNNKFFNGIIDEVRIYNRALSAEEIKLSYNKNMKNKKQTIIEIPINKNGLLEFGKSLIETISGKKVSLIFPKRTSAFRGDSIEVNLIGTPKGDFSFKFLIIKEDMDLNEALEVLKKYRKIKK